MINPIKSIEDLTGKLIYGDVINYQSPKPLPGSLGFTTTAPTITSVNSHPRQVPESWQQPLSDAYKANPSLPRGLLEATLMHESSMGTNPTQYNQANGESGWLGGMTDGARQELRKNKIPADLDTQAGVINAMASYMTLRQKGVDDTGRSFNYTDPARLYFERYKTNSPNANRTTPEDVQRFKSFVDYYKGQTPVIARDFNNLSQ